MLIEGNFQGQRKVISLDSNGQLAIGGLSAALTALGNITETGGSFQIQESTTMSVTDVSSRILLPGTDGLAVIIRNNGNSKVYFRLTDSNGVALLTDFGLDYNCSVGVSRTTETHIAAICDTGGTATLGVTVGSGSMDTVSVVNYSPSNVQLVESAEVIGKVRSVTDLHDVTLSTDTAICASGDVLADTQVVSNAVLMNGGHALLHSITVLDKDDQGQAMDLVFLRSNVSIGTENAAVSVTDTNAAEILGIVPVAASEFYDLGGCRIATLTGVGLVLETASDSTSLYIAAISKGTGTYTASGLIVKLGFASQD